MKNYRQVINYFLCLLMILTLGQTALATPSISRVVMDGVTAIPGDPISSLPTIFVTLTSTTTTLDSARLTIGANSSALNWVRSGTNYYCTTYETITSLSNGTQILTIEAFDSLGGATTAEISPYYVQTTGDVELQGSPLNYPNPFDPASQITTFISYTLSRPTNITLNIFDLTGTLVNSQAFDGQAGHNTAGWNGRTSSGSIVGNGIYVFLLLADGQVLQNGRGKITVFKR